MPPADNSNASASADAATAPQQSQTTEPGHTAPPSQDAQAQLAAAQKEASEWKGRAEKRAEEINRLKRIAIGDEPEKPEQQQTQPEPLTREEYQKDQSRRQFESDNRDQLDLLNDEGKKL